MMLLLRCFRMCARKHTALKSIPLWCHRGPSLIPPPGGHSAFGRPPYFCPLPNVEAASKHQFWQETTSYTSILAENSRNAWHSEAFRGCKQRANYAEDLLNFFGWRELRVIIIIQVQNLYLLLHILRWQCSGCLSEKPCGSIVSNYQYC